jgi:hypothetical protein
MPLGLIARLRLCRRPAVMIAAGLIVGQAFLAGLTMAQAAVMLTPGAADIAGFVVICHGNGGPDSDTGTAPDPAKSQHPCCLSCAASAAAATLPAQLIGLPGDRCRAVESQNLYVASIPIAPRAVRAGLSQAPPSPA